MNWCQFLPCWGQFLGYKEGGNQYWQDNCEENADFSDLNVMAISGGGWQVVCLQNICWAERIFSKAPTFWAFDRIGKLYLVSFWVMKSFVVLCERTCLWGSWFPFFSSFFIWCSLFPLDIWRFDRELFFRFADPFELFSGSRILSSPGCFTLKSWVFRVHSNYVFRSPEKLKISVFSIQVHWVFRSPEKNSKGSAHLKKIPCLTAKCPPGKVYIEKKEEKNGKQLPRRRVLTHAPRKAFHYPERDKNRPFFPNNGYTTDK